MRCAFLMLLVGCDGGNGGDSGASSSDDDGDGLTNSEEAALGTDPLVSDTDGDSYSDYAEVQEGTDPLDPSSVIYSGGWPYHSDKDSYGAPDFTAAVLTPGSLAPRFQMLDQYGEMVDIYDFADQDRPVLIVLHTEWATPCHDMASWIAGNVNNYLDHAYSPIDERIRSGEILMVTILIEDEDEDEALPSQANAESWHAAYSIDRPVLIPSDTQAEDFFVTFGLPTLVLLNPDMTINESFDSTNPYAALDYLMVGMQ